MGKGQSDPNANEGDGSGGEGIGRGRRPLGPEGDYKSFDPGKQRVDFDAKGKKIFDGYAPGQNFRKQSSSELEGEIRQASQEAPEAIEQQRIPRSYRESAKGYFRNLSGQIEKDKKKEPSKP